MKLKSCLRSFIFIIPLILVFSKSMAEPTFVRSVSIENVSGYTVNGLNFNNDGSKMYTTSHSSGNNARSDTIFEYTLTIPYLSLIHI